MTLPSTMQAAILVEQRQPLVIAEIELPKTLEVGQVLAAPLTLSPYSRLLA